MNYLTILQKKQPGAERSRMDPLSRPLRILCIRVFDTLSLTVF